MHAIVFGFILGLVALAACRSVLGTVTTAIVGALLTWAFLPFVGALLTWAFLPFVGVFFVGHWMIAVVSLFCGAGAGMLAMTFTPKASHRRTSVCLAVAASGVLAALLLLDVVSTPEMFHAAGYRALIGTVHQETFEQAIARVNVTGEPVPSGQVLDQSDVQLVDATIAERRAQELLGADVMLGSSYELGAWSRTRLGGIGPLVWAAPLDFAGIGPWLSNGSTPGYGWVDAHDARRAGLVLKTADGHPIGMRCTLGAWFGRDLNRVIRHAVPAGTAATDYSFEVGSGMRPFWVATTYQPQIGFSGDRLTGVLIVDPQTCETRRYAMESMPAWVNRVVPADVAVAWVSAYGRLRLGWWNAAFVGRDVTTPVTGQDDADIKLVATGNGHTAWYMGVTTPSRSVGTIGFMLVDSRSGRATFFAQSGATEEGAAAAITGKIRNYAGWQGHLPVLYNLFGRPTYLSIIKDDAGNMKGIGLVPVGDRNTVVVEDGLQAALSTYARALTGSEGGLPTGQAPVEITGSVTRIQAQVENGQTVYYFTLEGRSSIFGAAGGLGPQIGLTRPGDVVTVHVASTVDGTETVTELLNQTLPRPSTRTGEKAPAAQTTHG